MSESVVDSWLVGVVARDDALSGVRVHSGYVAAGPASGHSIRVQLRLRYESSGESGFPDSNVSHELLAIEEQAVNVLGDDAYLVAALTVPGFRDLIFHLTPDAIGRVAALVSQLGVREDDIVAVDDPSWSAYRAFFADAVIADGDRRKVEDIAKRFDHDVPNVNVEHFFAFDDVAQADQAAAALRDVGLEAMFVRDDTAGERVHFTVTELETLTQVEVAKSRDALGGFASSWEGEYLGWKAAEATPDSEIA